ncbi:hypothetical protein [Thalassospira australica]|uniref:hypothetical protein n=1 Tax=Thalassospira australica TaxID=1528106 RepID=UPI00051A772D|nr:hypothetical protein [Thalassospira australica]
MLYHFTVRQKDNEVYSYLSEWFLLADTEIPELHDWHSRWQSTVAQTFDPKEIAFGPYRRTGQQQTA